MLSEHRARIHAALGDVHRLAIVDALTSGDHSPRELAGWLGLPSNLLAHHLKVLESAGVIRRRESDGDARRRYVILAHEKLAALGSGHGVPGGPVLFVCTRNSARSQFAAALWRAHTGRPGESAGSEPADRVHPMAVTVAAEMGVDLAGARPKGLDVVTTTPDLVVSVCDRARETGLPEARAHLHWSIGDPADEGRIGAFRLAFREIAERVARLATAVEPATS